METHGKSIHWNKEILHLMKPIESTMIKCEIKQLQRIEKS